MTRNTTSRNAWLGMIAAVVTLFISAWQQEARANGILETVTVDTSALPTSPESEVVFYLIDGSGTGDGNNTAMLTSFGFGGGSAGAVDSLNSTGGFSGDMASGVSITDSSFPNVLAQFFNAGSQISFVLNLSTNVDAGPTPDQFGFAILDPSGNPIPTSDPTGDNNLMVINVDSSSPATVSYSDLVTVAPVGTAATPEPSSALMLGAGMFVLVLLSRRRRSAKCE